MGGIGHAPTLRAPPGLLNARPRSIDSGRDGYPIAMKAARLHAYHEALAVDELDEPRVAGPLDVVVRIGAAGLCRTDLHIQEGQWAEKSGVTLPYTLGHENAGWVHEVGSAVTNVEVGDTVIVHPYVTCGVCRPCRRGDDMHCVQGSFPGIDRDGGFADFLLTSARSVIKLDPSLEPKDIAALADAGLTAIHAVKKANALLGPGTRTVVIGAGGLGHIGIQCLKAMTPTEIIVMDPSEKALDLAREIGADHAVNVDGTQVDTVRELTDGVGAEAILDFVGEKGAIQDGVAMVQDGGFYFVIGYGENIDIPTIDVISREISFIGNLVGTYTDLEDLMTLTAEGKVRLHTSTYPLEAINDAMADLDQGRLQGRGILVPAGAD
jgi:NAD+-dependent secondary alcohol dehydrogenase Adh1